LIALVNRHSFRVEAYFEETKLTRVHPGDAAELRLLGDHVTLSGHVEGLARAISEPDVAGLLSNVNPTFHWVRLAQRIPVRIAIDRVPDGVTLASGMTCTVIVRPVTGAPVSTPLPAH
jgi:multidrug resistance efflux pump